jgi:two-component system sensor histidine kinase BaeS
MRRRLTAAMVLMVLGTLVLSGLASLGLAVHDTRVQTRHELVQEAQGLAATVQQEAEADSRTDPARALRTVLLALKSPLRLDGSAVVAVRPNGELFDPATPRAPSPLPTGLSAADLKPGALLSLQTVSGAKGGLLFAAVPYRAQVQIFGAPRQVVQAVVLTRRPPSALAGAGLWFALSSVVILLIAALVAYRLGRRFVQPIQAAQAVTSRVAAGDLGARVPTPRKADPELAALASSVNSMAARLEEAKGAEQQFLQSVSHELRTPLTSIRGFAEAIEDGATANTVAAAGIIAGEARRLERLVGDLLDLATLQTRRFTLKIQPVDLDAAIAAASAGFAPAAAELGLSLVADPEASEDGGGAVWVLADPDRLAQVVANLIENALRYARNEVRVSTTRRSHQAEVSVVDDGPGIPPEEQGRVFDRLFPDRPRTDRPIGSGLGLTIVAELAGAMGGSARVESPTRFNGGTRMVVVLPLAGPGPGNRAGANVPWSGALRQASASVSGPGRNGAQS